MVVVPTDLFQMIPSPQQLWTQAHGDDQEYRRLLLFHGHLRDATGDQRPSDHIFKGRTRSCPCEVCGGNVRASWHYSETKAIFKILGIEPELREEFVVRMYFEPGKVRIVPPEDAFKHSDHIQLVGMVDIECADVPEFALRRGHDLVISTE
jgi:hypothetical protein